ncbi:hypothetical protein SNE40_019493 [Patella caerulea]|uniref:Uncharacterized protein n=1 Tax=Patella caerulea TaxID=87958 RepID=A0AAN8PAG0_PATCE
MYASRNPIASEIKTVKSDIKDILQSGKYYCTEEIARELTKLDNGLDHLNFDNNLLTTSRTWQNNFDPNHTAAYRNNVVSAMDQTSARLFDLKNQLNVDKLKDKQENEIREKHEWAMNNLQSVQRSLDPYAYQAANRIKEFGDHIGVTDRFTQYRNNRMKIQDPARTQTQQMMRLERARTSIGTPAADLRTQRYGERMRENYGAMGNKVQFTTISPPARVYKGYRTIDSLYPAATTQIKPKVSAEPCFSSSFNEVKAVNTLNATDLVRTQELATQRQQEAWTQQPERSAAERAGINVIFPGTTLYSDEYVAPNLDMPTSHFVINPLPNFMVNGRPVGRAKILPTTNSEYQSRYEWPQGRKSTRLPWLNVH